MSLQSTLFIGVINWCWLDWSTRVACCMLHQLRPSISLYRARPHCGYFIYVCNLLCGLLLKHFQFSHRVSSQATRHKKHAHDKYTRIQPFTVYRKCLVPWLVPARGRYILHFIHVLFLWVLITINCCSVFQLAHRPGHNFFLTCCRCWLVRVVG